MTKRYREHLEEVELPPTQTPDGATPDGVAPTAFRWRGQRYQVLQVLGHWREDPGWWRRPDGEPVQIEQTDLWRVEAGRRVEAGHRMEAGHRGAGRRGGNGAAASRGVYELVRRGETWRLDRVWD